MAIWTEEIMNTPLIPNTTMVKRFSDGVHKTYRITPNEGYVMHDKNYDTFDFEYDEETGDIIAETLVSLGYRTSQGSVSASYDFTPFTMLDENGNEVTAYGDRQFYCKPITEVPENQIFGGGNNNTEIM